MSTLHVAGLRREYLQNPLGVTVKAPRFSWKLSSDLFHVLQGAYRIQVSRRMPASLRRPSYGTAASSLQTKAFMWNMRENRLKP